MQNSGLVTVEHADMLPHGHEDWLLWLDATGHGDGEEAAMLRKDTQRYVGFTRVAARRKPGNG